MRKGKKIQAVHTTGISCIRDTVASHCLISQNYVKKFLRDFIYNEIIYKITGGYYKTKYYIKIILILPEFSEKQ